MLVKKILRTARWGLKFNLIDSTDYNSPKTLSGKLEKQEATS